MSKGGRTKEASVSELLRRASVASKTAMRAIFAFHRAGPTTATAKSAYQRYERNVETFEREIGAISERVVGLEGVAAEYEAWIRYHAAGDGDFDDFLRSRQSQGDGHA